MKKILFALAIMPLLIVACSNDNVSKMDFDYNIEMLLGEWRATSIEGVEEDAIDLTDPEIEAKVKPTYMRFKKDAAFSTKGVLGEGVGKFSTNGKTITATVSTRKISFLMSSLDAKYAKIEVNPKEFNFGSIFDVAGDSISTRSKNLFKEMLKSYDKVDFVTTLQAKDDVVQIEMKTVDQEQTKKKKSKSDTEQDFKKMMSSLNGGVLLRGSVYKTGGIESFWVKSDQKNLISILFELPKAEVKIGDKWKLDVNFIANDQNFKCDSAFLVNEITLVNLKIIDGDTIAVLSYHIEEFVIGNFNSAFSEGSTLSKISMRP